MKTTFYWGWKDHTPQVDKTMERPRLARLMRAWRRAKTQGAREFNFHLVKRENGRREYRVSTTRYYPEDSATVIVERKA